MIISITLLFTEIYQMLKNQPLEVGQVVEAIEQEVAKPDEQVDVSFLEERFRNLRRMAPEILEIVTTTLANPLAGFGVIVTKVAKKWSEGAPE
jgi:hypothetical protein